MLCNSLASNGDQRLGEYLGKGLEPCSPASRHYNHRKPDLLFDPAPFSQETDVDYPSGLIENRQGIYHLLPHVAVIVHLFVIQDTYGVIICDPAYGLGNIPSGDDISSPDLNITTLLVLETLSVLISQIPSSSHSSLIS